MAAQAIQIAQAYVQIVPTMSGVAKAIKNGFSAINASIAEKYGKQLGETVEKAYKEPVSKIPTDTEEAAGKASSGFAAKLGVIAGIAQSIASKVINAFQGLAGEIFSASDSAQKFASTLKFAGVPTDQIKQLTDATQLYADKTVYDLNDIRNTTAQLAANGVPNYEKLAEAAGNLNAVAGGNATTFKSVAMVMTQTAGAGKLTTENWNQLSDAIPGASGKIQQALLQAGAYTGNFRDALQKGQISADEFNKAIMDLGFTDAAQEAATSTATIEGSMGNLQAAAVKMGAGVLDAVKPMVTGTMSTIADALSNAAPMLQDGVKNVITYFQNLFKQLQDNGTIKELAHIFDVLKQAIEHVVNTVLDWTKFLPRGSMADGIKLIVDLFGKLVDNGHNLVPVVTSVGVAFGAVGGYNAMVDGLHGITNGLQDATNFLHGAAEGINGFSKAISDVKSFGDILNNVKDFAKNLEIVKAAQEAWNAVTELGSAVATVFNAVLEANPLMIWIPLVTAVVAALTWFFTQTELGRKVLQGFFTFLGNVWNGILPVVQAACGAIGSFFSGLWDSISAGASAKWNALCSVLSGIWNGLVSTVTSIFSGIGSALDAIHNGISTAAQAAWNAIKSVLTPIVQGIGEFIKDVFIVLAAVLVTIWNGISTAVQTVWNAIVSFLKPIVQGIADFIGTVIKGFQTVWNAVWEAVKSFAETIWNGIVSAATTLFNSMKTAITTEINVIQNVWNTVWNAVKSVAQTIWNAIVSMVTTVLNTMSSVINGALHAIQGVWTSIWNAVSGFLGSVWNGMVSAVSNAVGAIGQTVRGIYNVIMNALSGAGRWLYDVGSNIIRGLINGIGGAFNWVKDTIMNLGNSVLNWAKGVLGIHSPSRVFRDKVGKFISLGMAQGIRDNMSAVAASVNGLTGLIPEVGIDTHINQPSGSLSAAMLGSVDARMQASYQGLSKRDMVDALDAAFSQGMTLHLNAQGGQVLAGKLARPMSFELETLTRRGR